MARISGVLSRFDIKNRAETERVGWRRAGGADKSYGAKIDLVVNRRRCRLGLECECH